MKLKLRLNNYFYLSVSKMDSSLTPSENTETKFIEACSILNECAHDQTVLDLNNHLYYKDMVTGIFNDIFPLMKCTYPYSAKNVGMILSTYLYRLGINMKLDNSIVEPADEQERRVQHEQLPLAPYGYRFTETFIEQFKKVLCILNFCNDRDIRSYSLDMTKYPEIGTYLNEIQSNTDVPFSIQDVKNKIARLSIVGNTNVSDPKVKAALNSMTEIPHL